MRCSCSGSASTVSAGSIGGLQRHAVGRSPASSAAASSAARQRHRPLGRRPAPRCCRRPARWRPGARPGRAPARAGAGPGPPWDRPTAARRSEAIWALVSMLRRSWLILATASPSAASRAREARAARRSALHPLQLALGAADLVAAARGADARGRILAGRRGTAPWTRVIRCIGPHQEEVQRQVDHRAGHHRGEGGDRQQPAELVEQVAASAARRGRRSRRTRRRGSWACAITRIMRSPPPARVRNGRHPGERTAAAQVDQIGRAHQARARPGSAAVRRRPAGRRRPPRRWRAACCARGR